MASHNKVPTQAADTNSEMATEAIIAAKMTTDAPATRDMSWEAYLRVLEATKGLCYSSYVRNAEPTEALTSALVNVDKFCDNPERGEKTILSMIVINILSTWGERGVALLHDRCPKVLPILLASDIRPNDRCYFFQDLTTTVPAKHGLAACLDSVAALHRLHCDLTLSALKAVVTNPCWWRAVPPPLLQQAVLAPSAHPLLVAMKEQLRRAPNPAMLQCIERHDAWTLACICRAMPDTFALDHDVLKTAVGKKATSVTPDTPAGGTVPSAVTPPAVCVQVLCSSTHVDVGAKEGELLFDVVASGDGAMMAVLLSAAVAPTTTPLSPSVLGKVALLAAHKGHVAVSDALLSPSNPHPVDWSFRFDWILHLLAENGHIRQLATILAPNKQQKRDSVRDILQRETPHQTQKAWEDLLSAATRAGQGVVVQYLLHCMRQRRIKTWSEAAFRLFDSRYCVTRYAGWYRADVQAAFALEMPLPAYAVRTSYLIDSSGKEQCILPPIPASTSSVKRRHQSDGDGSPVVGVMKPSAAKRPRSRAS